VYADSAAERCTISGGRAPVAVDINGDGDEEVLYVESPPLESRESATLAALSASGRPLRRFRPGRTVATSRETFGPPFSLFGFLVLPQKPGKPAQILAVGYHRLSYPTQVALLSAEGKLLREYWHSGHLSVFAPANASPGHASPIYLGGVANGHKSAVFVALDPDAMDGASREENIGYQLSSASASHARKPESSSRARVWVKA
jgi:hypothetical protein